MHLKFVSFGWDSNPRLLFLQPMYQHDTANWYRRYQVNHHSDLCKSRGDGMHICPRRIPLSPKLLTVVLIDQISYWQCHVNIFEATVTLST